MTTTGAGMSNGWNPIPAVALVLVLTAPQPAAARECAPAPQATRAATVRFAIPEGAMVAGVTVEVAYPSAKVVVPGSGWSLPKGTVTDAPADTILAVDDRDGTIRVSVASAKAMTPGRLFTLHVAPCIGAAAAAPDEFGCRVVEAADIAPLNVPGVTCSVALP